MSNTPCLPKSPMSLFTLLSGIYVDYYKDTNYIISLADVANEALFNKQMNEPFAEFLCLIEKIG